MLAKRLFLGVQKVRGFGLYPDVLKTEPSRITEDKSGRENAL